MTVRVITPPTVTQLVTAAQVAEFTGYSAANVNALIPVVSRILINRIDRHVLYGQYEETKMGTGGQMLQLGVIPIDESQPLTVEIDGNTEDASNFRIEDPEAGWLFLERGWPNSEPRIQWLETSIIGGQGEQIIKVTYWAGWLIDLVDPDNTTLPEDISYAAALGVSHLGQRGGRNMGIARWRSADVDISYTNNVSRSGEGSFGSSQNTILPEDILSMVDCYADVVGEP